MQTPKQKPYAIASIIALLVLLGMLLYLASPKGSQAVAIAQLALAAMFALLLSYLASTLSKQTGYEKKKPR